MCNQLLVSVKIEDSSEISNFLFAYRTVNCSMSYKHFYVISFYWQKIDIKN